MNTTKRDRIRAIPYATALGLLLLLATTATWADGIEGPKSFVESAHYRLVYVLEELDVEDAKIIKRLEKALDHLEASLDDEAWLVHAGFLSVLSEDGAKAFSEIRKAAKDLEKIEDEPGDVLDEVGYALDDLFAAACDLAENEILSAMDTMYGHLDEDTIPEVLGEADRPKQAEKALDDFLDALEEHADDEFAQAIRDFEHSWKNALRIPAA